MTEQQILQAMNCTPWGQMSQDQRAEQLTQIVSACYEAKAQQVPDSRLRSEVKELRETISLQYPYLTACEVSLALSEGSSGAFDLSAVNNLANMRGWLRAYTSCTARLEAKTKYQSEATSRNIAEERRNRMAKVRAQFEKGGAQEAYDIFLRESTDEEPNPFIFPQYVDAIYNQLRNMGRMGKVSEATLKDATAAARVAYRRKFPNLFQQAASAGANDPTLDMFIHQELVLRYFNALRKAGRATL